MGTKYREVHLPEPERVMELKRIIEEHEGRPAIVTDIYGDVVGGTLFVDGREGQNGDHYRLCCPIGGITVGNIRNIRKLRIGIRYSD